MKKRNPRVTSGSDLDKGKEFLVAQRKHLFISFVEAVQQKKLARMSKVFDQLTQTDDYLSCLERIEKTLHAEKQKTIRRYTVSSLFLSECFKELTADRDEQFFFITGAAVNDTYVLDLKLEFKHSKRSVVGVVGNQTDTHRLLIKLEEFGHRLLAHFHSHPGNGFDATQPSSTDTGFQKRLEDAGYPSVATIFSRDGYVRFFRLDDDLEVEVYGLGVEQHAKNSFRITAVS